MNDVNKSEDFKITLECNICNDRELQVVKYNGTQMMQCLSCGYSTSDDYKGMTKSSEEYEYLDKNMKKWAKEVDGYIWIPAVMQFTNAIYYPIPSDNEMVPKWAYVNVIQISPEEQKNYPIQGKENEYYKQRYDTDNEIIFDNFGTGIIAIHKMLENKTDEKDVDAQKIES